jgi:hypothetical protein
MMILEDIFRKRCLADLQGYGVTGWLSKGIGSEKMQRLKEEIEGRGK